MFGAAANQPLFVKDEGEFVDIIQQNNIVAAGFTRIGQESSTKIVLGFATTTLFTDHPEVKFVMVTDTAGKEVFDFAGSPDPPRFLIWKNGEKLSDSNGPIVNMEQLREALTAVGNS